MMTFFENTRKVLTKRPSSSIPSSNYPPQNDTPRGNSESESSKKKPTTAWPRKHASLPREKDDIHTRHFQPNRKPTQESLWKETQTIPPESIPPSYHIQQNSMHELSVLIQEKKKLEDELLETKDTLDSALNANDAYTKEAMRLKEEVQRLDAIVISMNSAEKIAANKIDDLEKKLLQRDENIRNLEQKLRISEEQRLQTTKLLDERTAELRGAQAFMTTADLHSGAEIIKMAESLNAEIFQASALMAELLVDDPVAEDSVIRRQKIKNYEKDLRHGRKIMGSQLFDHLVTKSKEIRVDPLPLQLAFQALFTKWCAYEVDHFCEGPTGESFKQIYRGICESETQAAAGRWRVMTSVQTMKSDTPSKAHDVYNIIVGLMWICGGFGSQDTSQRAKLSVEQAVLRVEKIWKTLKVAVMQEITAAEITVRAIDPGVDYDAATMDDMYMDESSDVPTNPEKEQILCPVGVGLRRDVSKRCEDGTMQMNGEVILKPKIALTSVLLKGEPSRDTQEKMTLSPTDGKD